MSKRLFKIISNYTNNNDYSFQDLKDFIDEKILEDEPKPKTIATRYSLVKNFLRDNYQQITDKQLKLIRPDEEITNGIIQKDLEIKSNKKNVVFNKELVDKILDFKNTENIYELAMYLQFISGRRADEIKDKEYIARVGKDKKLKMLLSKKNGKNQNKYYQITLIPNTLSPEQFKNALKMVRQNFSHIGSNDYIKRLNRKIKKLVRSDLTSHSFRGMYATYLFNNFNHDNQNINGFIEKVLNHDSSGSSLNYSNYLYEDGFKNKSDKEIDEEKEKEEN